MKKRVYRMYGLVPYSLSGEQKMIQFGHGIHNAYQIEFGEDEDYKQWATKDMTVMALNGGTTNMRITEEGIPFGTLNQHSITLDDMEVKHSHFYEPDLGDQLTAITFLVDERVWDHKGEYPNFKYDEHYDTHYGSQFYEWKMKFSDDEDEADRIVEIRKFLSQFRMA